MEDLQVITSNGPVLYNNGSEEDERGGENDKMIEVSREVDGCVSRAGTEDGC